MLFLTTLLMSIIVTIAVMPHSRELAIRFHAMDKPAPRKTQLTVMPRCGGIAMAVGTCMPIMLWAPKTLFVKGLLLGALIIVIFGVADDIKNLRPGLKLLGQTLAALVVIMIGGIKISDIGLLGVSGPLLPDWAAVPLTAFVIVGVTNATNLSDGLDGLAGGISLLVFLCIGYLGVNGKDWVTVMAAIAAGGSILGFLRFNSYPAQLYMGDAGSQLLGFVAIVLALKLAQQATGVSPLLPLILFGIPILDTITVMIKRILEGRSPLSADRNHFHHQLITVGLLHMEAVLIIYLAQALLVLFAIVYHGSGGWFLLSAYLLFAGGVSGTFYFVYRTGYQVDRDRFLNRVRARLELFKNQGQIIRFSFGMVKIGLPALLVFNALFQPAGNKSHLMLSAGLLFLLLMAWILNRRSLDRVAKIAFYLITPFIIFRCDLNLYSIMGPWLIGFYNALYLLLLSSVFLTMKLTRRSEGYKSSTLDFLVIFVILLITNLPEVAMEGYLLGLVAVKTVIFYYSSEVLVGESRRKPVKLHLGGHL